jgi:hypothetical protein
MTPAVVYPYRWVPHRLAFLASIALSTVIALLGPISAEGKVQTSNVPLGTYRLQVSLSYQAEASNDSLESHPAPIGEGPAAYWSFSIQSESATVNASWTDELQLNKIAEGTNNTQIQPVHYPHAQGEIHDIEYHALGSPGIDASISDSFTAAT